MRKNQLKFLDKFNKNEIEIQAKLVHKNIIELYYILENPHFIFLVMELMEGGSLKEFIINRYKDSDVFLTEFECSLIMKNIFNGIDFLHSNGIIHRDIKPENIMIKNKNDLNSIKIGDFGFSMLKGDEEFIFNECGTIIYMPPESHQLLPNESSDIWASGIILYILCSGGIHPYYIENMTSEAYFSRIKHIGETCEFSDNFPL